MATASCPAPSPSDGARVPEADKEVRLTGRTRLASAWSGNQPGDGQDQGTGLAACRT